MKQLGCTYTPGSPNSYSCRISSNETLISRNFTLLRVSGRGLRYSLTVRAVSAAPSNSEPLTRHKFTVAANEHSTEDEDNTTDTTGFIVGMVVFVCLVFAVVALSCYVRQLSRRKRQLRWCLAVSYMSVWCMFWSSSENSSKLCRINTCVWQKGREC